MRFADGYEFNFISASPASLRRPFDFSFNFRQVLTKEILHKLNIPNPNAVLELLALNSYHTLSLFSRGRGGTGRRAGLRSLWAQARGSSILLVRIFFLHFSHWLRLNFRRSIILSIKSPHTRNLAKTCSTLLIFFYKKIYYISLDLIRTSNPLDSVHSF